MKPMIETEVEDDDKHIQMWKIKRLIKNLDNQQGNGSSMVSLIIPPKEQLSKMNELLTKEYGTAQNIKSSKTKQTVSTAIVSTKEKLKLYRKTPDNGLVIFCGQVLLDDGKTEKKITIDFEPFRPINQFLYKCDTKFHTGPLQGLLQDSDTFGFIIVDGNGVVYATLQGNNREIKQKIQVDLPQKHNKGGQSSVRFARIAEEKRGVYLKKVAELATANFITNDMPNGQGLILAGSADFKYKLNDSQDFDPRLKKVVIKVIDVAYGGENGLSQAIQLASDALANVKFVAEKRLIQKFFEEIALDTNMIVFGVKDTLLALEGGAVDTIILFESLEVTRYELKNPAKGNTIIQNLNKIQEKDPKYFKDAETGVDLDVIGEPQLLSEWLCNHYKDFGSKLEIVTDTSQEGFQFANGFGGLGGFLRYKLDVVDCDVADGVGGDDFDADEDFI